MKFVFQSEKFGSLAFGQFRYRNAGPAGDDPCDFIICDSFVYQTAVAFFDLFFLDLKLFLEFRKFPILQFGSFFQIVVLFCFLDLFIDILDLLT